jgi:heat shock protein HtpX
VTSQIKTALLLGLMTGLILILGRAMGGSGGLVIALIIALGMNVFSYWYSDKIVLKMYKARELAPSDAPALHRMVEDLSEKAGIPKPRVYLIPQEAPNAFATGRGPGNAVVAVTEGIMRILSVDELRGVLAHEIGHVKNRDVLIQTVAGVLAGVIMFVASMIKWGAIFGMGRDSEEGGNPLVALGLAIIAPIAAMLIQMAISRSREYLADSTGARLAGEPRHLASALQKLSDHSRRAPMRQGNPATAHLFIVNPFAGGMSNMFSTHPPVEERVKRLLDMSGERG